MTAPHTARKLTDEVIRVLEDADLRVGDAQAPKPATVPYCVVYPLIGGVATGTLDEREPDFEALYQVTGVGSDRRQAEWVSDKARVALLSAQMTVPGREILYVRTDMSGGIQRDDDVQPPLFYVPDRYRVMTVGV